MEMAELRRRRIAPWGPPRLRYGSWHSTISNSHRDRTELFRGPLARLARCDLDEASVSLVGQKIDRTRRSFANVADPPAVAIQQNFFGFDTGLVRIERETAEARSCKATD